MTTLRRIVTIGGTAAIAVSLFAPAASADELTDYLARAQQSTYTANRLTVSVWGDETQVSSAFVEHANGTEMVRVDSTWSVVGNGKSVIVSDAAHGIAFVSHADPISTDRYAIGDVTNVRHMRRDCQVVEVLEGGNVRAQILVDSRTGAPLITETYTDTGTVFRRSSLQDFRAYRTYSGPSEMDDLAYEVLMPLESDLLPTAVAGYQLVDIFPGPGNAEQGFYSDGLFTFSLFALSEAASVSGFESSMPFVTNDGTYDLVATPNDARVRWSGTDRQYVMVGDLPPDHLEQVLAELPHPDVPSMFIRWWSRIFG